MLIDFSVKNFRSFRTEQRISFVASNYFKELPDNVFDPKLPGLTGVKLLKAIGIYGANAAGKTNVLMALSYLDHFVETSATELEEGDGTGVEAFALCPDAPRQPTEFALRFVAEGVRYHFALVLDRTRVLFECLSAFPKGVERVWYQRSWDEDTQTHHWGPERPTGYKRDTRLEGYTRQNALYLSTAAKWNQEEVGPAYRWFKQRLRFLRLTGDHPALPPSFTVKYLNRGANERNAIVRLLRSGDFGLLSVKAAERALTRDDLPKELPGAIAEEVLKDGKQLEVELGHLGVLGKEYPLAWEDESSGTRKMFALSGPWLDVLEHGYLVGVDELESSLHPAMAMELLRLLFGTRHNPHNAQCLFTTHNPLLLDPTLMRRDQVWFAEKDEEGATRVYPLSDYKPRSGESESLLRGYLAGRYGATPFFPNGLMGQEPDGG
jgi:uncharacterized protein